MSDLSTGDNLDDYYSSDDEDDDSKNIIYEIYGPDNVFKSYCPKKRFQWYLNKDPKIAILMENKENAIKLLFNPTFKGTYIKKFVKRDYICSICGTKSDLKIIHVINSKFKKYLPVHKKSHNSSDIIYLCNK